MFFIGKKPAGEELSGGKYVERGLQHCSGTQVTGRYAEHAVVFHLGTHCTVATQDGDSAFLQGRLGGVRCL